MNAHLPPSKPRLLIVTGTKVAGVKICMLYIYAECTYTDIYTVYIYLVYIIERACPSVLNARPAALSHAPFSRPFRNS